MSNSPTEIHESVSKILISDITNHFKNALISSVLKEELCFLHCTRTELGPNPGGKMGASEFEPVPGTYCQTLCWRNWKVGKNVELYGLYDLLKTDNDWDVNLYDFLSESFRHWQDHRFDRRDENLFPTVDELLTLEATSSSGSFLPVCYSEVLPPAAVSDADRLNHLPCLCGNDLGNETRSFFKEDGFDQWVANKDGYGVAGQCLRRMGQTAVPLPPLLSYLELCDNGWHFALEQEHHHRLGQGADDQCDKVRELQTTMLEQGHDYHTINCRICFDTPVGALIKESQKHFVRIDGKTATAYNFEEACLRYDQNPETSCLY